MPRRPSVDSTVALVIRASSSSNCFRDAVTSSMVVESAPDVPKKQTGNGLPCITPVILDDHPPLHILISAPKHADKVATKLMYIQLTARSSNIVPTTSFKRTAGRCTNMRGIRTKHATQHTDDIRQIQLLWNTTSTNHSNHHYNRPSPPKAIAPDKYIK